MQKIKSRIGVPELMMPEDRKHDNVAILIDSLKIKKGDIIISVGGGCGASIEPEILAACRGARVIVVNKEGVEPMGPGITDGNPIEYEQTDFMKYELPGRVRGFFMPTVLGIISTKGADAIVSKALDAMRNPGDFLVASSYLHDARKPKPYQRDFSRIQEIARERGIEFEPVIQTEFPGTYVEVFVLKSRK